MKTVQRIIWREQLFRSSCDNAFAGIFFAPFVLLHPLIAVMTWSNDYRSSVSSYYRERPLKRMKGSFLSWIYSCQQPLLSAIALILCSLESWYTLVIVAPEPLPEALWPLSKDLGRSRNQPSVGTPRPVSRCWVSMRATRHRLLRHQTGCFFGCDRRPRNWTKVSVKGEIIVWAQPVEEELGLSESAMEMPPTVSENVHPNANLTKSFHSK